MTVIIPFAIGTVFAFTSSLLAVAVLHPHLTRLLGELCGSRARANFWAVACTLCLLLLGVLAGTVSFGYPPGTNLSAQQVFFGFVTQVRACLLGLLVGVLTTAWLLIGSIRRFEQRLGPAPSAQAADGSARGAPGQLPAAGAARA
jgi:hypothetical protein